MLDGAADLHHLLPRGTEPSTRHSASQRKAVLLDQPAGILEASAAVHPAQRQRVLTAEEDVLRHAQMRRQQRFLVHHGDADPRGLGGFPEMNFAAVPQHAAGVALHLPATIFISVDLPAPFSPSRRCTSPAATARLPSRSAVTPPNRLVMP